MILFLVFSLLILTSCNNIGNNDNNLNDKDGEFIMRNALDESSFLKVVGKNIYDDNGKGNLVQLKGVNVGGYLFQELWMTPTRDSKNIKAEMDIYTYLSDKYGQDRMRELISVYQDNYFTEEDFDNLYNLGVNVIRLPFWYMNIVDFEGNFLKDWHLRFDWFISQAGKRGMYVILDFHGAPGSQNGSDHSGIDGGEFKEEASQFFFGDKETVDKNRQLYYIIWEEIASRYKDNPVVAGYDLLNEPFCTYRYTSSLEDSQLHNILWEVYDTAYKRIREIDNMHIIIMEATWDSKDLPDPNLYGWTNVMYQYHNYHYDDYNNEDGKQIKSMQNKLNLIKSANYDLPSMMGEFSYFNKYETWDEGIDLLTKNGIHWTMWTYKTTSDRGNWGLYHNTGGDINIELIDDVKLESIWSKVGDIRPNQPLVEIISKYCQKPYISYEK